MRFHKYYFLFLFFFFLTFSTQSQNITGGPIVGGVTSSTARVYVRTENPSRLKLQFSSFPDFAISDFIVSKTDAKLQNALHFELSGLLPDTRYHYRIFNDSSENLLVDQHSFKTFPIEGEVANVRLIVGSCNYNNMPGGGQGNPNFQNDLMFQSMVDFDPHLFLHLGDWGYPPSALGSNHLLDRQLAAQSFDLRYRDPNMKNYIMPNMAIDYIYDDDYSQNGTAGWTYPAISTETLPSGSTRYVLEDLPHPEGLRDSCIAAYFKHFPGYPQVDTSGIHHKITIGTIDIFVADTRSSKSPVHEAFKYNEILNSYIWRPGADRTTLGEIQRTWLLNEMKNSVADWKIMASSVLFNRKMGDFLGIVLAAQLFDRSLVEFATSIAYMWAGYPKDMNAILNLVKDENIENVLLFTGDTHSSMMDDGRNAGLPELSSSGLSADDEGYLNYTIDSIINEVGAPISVKQNLWNGGGSGIENANFSDTYASVEFFGKDSVQMCIIDEFLQVLSCMTIRNTNAVVTKNHSSFFEPEHVFQMLYPNPTKTNIEIRLGKMEIAVMHVLDIDGRAVLPPQKIDIGDKILNFNVSQLPAGVYIMLYESESGSSSRKFVKK